MQLIAVVRLEVALMVEVALMAVVAIMVAVAIMVGVPGMGLYGSVRDGVDGRHGGVLHTILTIQIIIHIILAIHTIRTIRKRPRLSSNNLRHMYSPRNSITGITARIQRGTIRT